MGCQIIKTGKSDNHVDLNQLMSKISNMKIDSILLEGGGELNWSMLKSGFVNKVQAYIAPKIFGGKDAKSPVSGIGVPEPSDAFMLYDKKVKHLGSDILIESRVKKCSQE